VAREFRRRIKNRFDREELEIPFPSRRVHVRVEGGPGPDPIAHAAAGAAGG
jgi:small conductance mechanosensitive channel